MTQGFRQVRVAQKRNTLRPVFCVLYELDDDELKCFLWIPSRPVYSPDAVGYKQGFGIQFRKKFGPNRIGRISVGFRIDFWEYSNFEALNSFQTL